MLADRFTKPLQGELFRVVRTKMLYCYMIYCIKDVELEEAKTIRECVLYIEFLRV